MDSSKASSTMKSNEDPKREIPPQATSTAKQTSVDLDNSIRSTGSNLKEKDLSRVKRMTLNLSISLMLYSRI